MLWFAVAHTSVCCSMVALLYNTLLLASPAAYCCILRVSILPLLQLLLRHCVADCTIMLLLLPVTTVACLCCSMLLHFAATAGRQGSALPCFLIVLLHVAYLAAAVAFNCFCFVTCRAPLQSAAATVLLHTACWPCVLLPYGTACCRQM